MPRIKLDPQDRYQHIYETAIEVTDLNYGNHIRLIALAETGIVAFNYHKREVARVPESFISKIADSEA